MLLVIAGLAAAALCVESRGQGMDTSEKLAQIVEKTKKEPIDKVWRYERVLKELPDSAADDALKMLKTVPPKARVLLDKVLMFWGEHAAAMKDLMELVQDSTVDRDVRVAAVDLLRVTGGKRQGYKLLDKLDDFKDPYVHIAVCRFVFKKTGNVKATRTLHKYLDNDDFDVRAAAAVALAQLDDYERTRPILEQLREEPSPRGQLAQSLLDQERLFKIAERTSGLERDPLLRAKDREIERLRQQVRNLRGQLIAKTGSGVRLLDELMQRIADVYVDAEKTNVEKLIESAAKGMLSGLDPYSVYMDEKEVKAFLEDMTQRYSGIGAVVTKQVGEYLTIQSPIYGGPAYDAGLRSGDKITEADGTNLRDLSLIECVKLLKGKAGTKVKVKVWRRSWPKEREIEIVRAQISTKTVYSRMLPEGVGYMILTSFSGKTDQEVEDALKAMKAVGMKSLIIDLRGNPGGRLDKVINVANKFLEAGQVIVTSKGRNPKEAPERTYRADGKGNWQDLPMVVLVNGGSASASEILSGALKDHGRALIVGERTYGKGSVQQIYPVVSTAGKTRIKLTIALYYLPRGESIDRTKHEHGKWGVTPDVEVKQPEWPLAWWTEHERLLDADVFGKYLDARYKAHRETFLKLAANDHGKTEGYPEFDKWYDSLGTKMPKDLVRRMLRVELLRKVSDDRAMRFVGDYVDDLQLQRAIVEVMKKMKKDAKDSEDYRFFATGRGE